jgi:cob(I)alamin adenosyltransferase
MVYLNRLSDLLFVMGRVANGNGATDVLWMPGKFARGEGQLPSAQAPVGDQH